MIALQLQKMLSLGKQNFTYYDKERIKYRNYGGTSSGSCN